MTKHTQSDGATASGVRVARIAACVCVVVIGWGLLAPRDPVPRLFASQDALEHIVAFMLLTFTTAASLRRLAVSVALMVGVAIAVEFLQGASSPFRDPSVRDATASIVGVLLGAGAFLGGRALNMRWCDSRVPNGSSVRKIT